MIGQYLYLAFLVFCIYLAVSALIVYRKQIRLWWFATPAIVIAKWAAEWTGNTEP